MKEHNQETIDRISKDMKSEALYRQDNRCLKYKSIGKNRAVALVKRGSHIFWRHRDMDAQENSVTEDYSKTKFKTLDEFEEWIKR